VNQRVLEFVLDWFEQVRGRRPLPDEDMFGPGGLDSLDFVELVGDLADSVGVELNPEEVEDWDVVRTPRGLAGLVDRAEI